MKRIGKQKKWILMAISAVGILALGYIALGRSSEFVEIDTLKGKPVVKAGFLSAAHRGDVVEPYEYRAYCWKQPFAKTRAQLDIEMKSKGFQVMQESDDYVLWYRNDLEVSLYASGEPLSDGSTVPDSGKSLVFYWHKLDKGFITQLRMWLFQSKSSSD